MRRAEIITELIDADSSPFFALTRIMSGFAKQGYYSRTPNSRCRSSATERPWRSVSSTLKNSEAADRTSRARVWLQQQAHFTDELFNAPRRAHDGIEGDW